MRSIYIKELSIRLSSSMFYVISTAFVCIFGIFFFNSMACVSMLAIKTARNHASETANMIEIMIRPVFYDLGMLVVFFTPLISMGLYAEEKARGTMELILAYPVSDLDVLAGKYLASLSMLALMLLFTSPLMAVLSLVITPDWGVIISCYAGVFLLGAAILSIGTFASSLTGSQMIAAALTIAITLFFWTIGWFLGILGHSSAGIVFQGLSLVYHVSPFLKGVISFQHIVFFICLSLFFLMLTFIVLDAGRRRR